MILRSVQGCKIIIIRFDFTSLINLKAHSCKNINKLISDQGNRVQISDPYRLCRDSKVDLFPLISVHKLQLFHFVFHIRKSVKSPAFEIINGFSISCSFFRGKLSHFLHQLADLALFPFKI